MRIVAVIIAGGRSSRMGREKLFEAVGGRTILERIISCLQPQVQAVAINANEAVARFRDTGFPVVPDLRGGVATPLAGLHAALTFAKQARYDAVLSVPSDCPFLPSDLRLRLEQAEALAAIGASGGQSHFVTGLWRVVLLQQLQAALDQPCLMRLQDWAREVDAATVEWRVHPYDPFFNVNTPEELAESNRIAAEFDL